MSEPNNNHLDDVFGDIRKLPEHSELPKRKIKPWHKPRKQWIRRHQWLKEIDSLCALLHFRDGRPLRYLSLPGEDLLDVRVVRECCQKRNIKLKYLGLNEDYSSDSPNTWLHIGCNEVNAHASVVRDSLVIKDRFEKLADKNSPASRYAEQYGPFDVVNLDLCSSISPLKSRDLNYYEALKSLANFQIKNRAGNEPWLLLITSRTGGPWVLEEDMKKLANCIQANATAHADFAKSLNRLVSGGDSLAASADTKWSELEQGDFLNLFSVGFGKWLLQLLSSSTPKWSIKLLSSYSYKVAAKTPDMLSLAFLVEPHIEGVYDRSGLSSTQAHPTSTGYDEKSFALELISDVAKIEDLDQKLDNDTEAYNTVEQETIDLLVSVRYDKKTVEEGLAKFRSCAA